MLHRFIIYIHIFLIGLLPVRWMAVECLTDGVFSRASDVWAWAVLCWEVATLGQQPYSALLNHAVMRYVRGGGTLQRPPNCSMPLYVFIIIKIIPTADLIMFYYVYRFTLLQKCWSYNPEQRPTFKYCLEELDALMETVEEDATLITAIAEEPQYITVVPDGKINILISAWNESFALLKIHGLHNF